MLLRRALFTISAKITLGVDYNLLHRYYYPKFVDAMSIGNLFNHDGYRGSPSFKRMSRLYSCIDDGIKSLKHFVLKKQWSVSLSLPSDTIKYL